MAFAKLWWRSAAFAALCMLASASTAQAPTATDARSRDDLILEKVIVLSRHGVRSPLQTGDKLALYSHSAWPTWDAPPGFLTRHGRALMTSFGSFYGLFYQPQGLFSGQGCARAQGIYVWSDTDERDLSTASSFLDGLFPGCAVSVHHVEGEDAIDPIVHPLKAHLGHPDKERAAAEVLGRVGGDGNNVKLAYMPALLTLDRILGGCGKPVCEGEQPGRQVLFTMSASIDPASDDDHLIRESSGPLSIGSTLSEILLLEYADGKPMNDAGFGRMSRADLTQVLGLHAVYTDLAQQTDYPARVLASNMMQHILATLTSATLTPATLTPATLTPATLVPATPEAPGVRKSGTGGFGPPGSRFVFLATHDTNIATVAGLLRIHWMMPGDQADPTPPGCALVFELRRERAGGKRWVRLRFISETLDQMHDGATLTLDHPPAVLPVFIPGCSIAAHANECSLDAFARLVNERTLPEFTTP